MLRSERDDPGVRGVVVSPDILDDIHRSTGDAGMPGDFKDAGDLAGLRDRPLA